MDYAIIKLGNKQHRVRDGKAEFRSSGERRFVAVVDGATG